MTIEAHPVNFLLDNERRLTPEGLAQKLNELLDTGTYIGHILVPKPTQSAWDNRMVGELTAGVVVLIDKPD